MSRFFGWLRKFLCLDLHKKMDMWKLSKLPNKIYYTEKRYFDCWVWFFLFNFSNNLKLLTCLCDLEGVNLTLSPHSILGFSQLNTGQSPDPCLLFIFSFLYVFRCIFRRGKARPSLPKLTIIGNRHKLGLHPTTPLIFSNHFYEVWHRNALTVGPFYDPHGVICRYGRRSNREDACMIWIS